MLKKWTYVAELLWYIFRTMGEELLKVGSWEGMI